MSVVAITRIVHGAEDGTVKTFEIGDTLSLPEDQLRDLVQGGSAVELGKDRKFASPLAPGATSDEDTRKRDELIAKSQSESDENGPPNPVGTGAPSAEEAARQLREKEEAEAKANAKANK